MTNPSSGSLPGVVFLDDDPVMKLARAMLDPAPSRADIDWIASYIWPERLVSIAGQLAAARAGAGWSAGAITALDTTADAPAIKRDEVLAIVFRRGVIDQALLERYPNLRAIQRFAPSDVDLASDVADEIRRRDIEVSSFHRRSIDSVAEHAVALTLAVVRRIRQFDAITRSGFRARHDRDPRSGNVCFNWAATQDVPVIAECRVGIVGLGDIGTGIARRMSAMGAEVMYAKRTPPADADRLPWRHVTKDELLTASDVVIVSAPPAADGGPVLDRADIESMQQGSHLINISRGAAVDQVALFDALVSGRLAGAGIDVYAVEPVPVDEPLLQLPNVVATPHVAGRTRLDLFDEVARFLAQVAAAAFR